MYGHNRKKNKGTVTLPVAIQALSGCSMHIVQRPHHSLSDITFVTHSIAATSIWEIGREKATQTYVDFADKVGQSDLAVFGFNDDIIMDLWGICDDGKKGRFQVNKDDLPPGVKEFNDKY